MKKIIIALAAVTTLAAGASAAQAKVNVDLYFGGFGGHGHGYGHGYYEPVDYGYESDCHYVTKKKVTWKYGHKIVKYKKILVCNSY
jgi:hypothetical protein